MVSLVDSTNRPTLRLLRSLDVELSLCDGLVEGRQRLPHRPLVTVSTARGSHQAEAFGGKAPPRGGFATRVLTAPLTFQWTRRSRFVVTTPKGARQQEDGMNDTTAIDSVARRRAIGQVGTAARAIAGFGLLSWAAVSGLG